MVEDLQVGLINEYLSAGWRVAPFIKTQEGYIGVKAWPKRAASNNQELQTLIEEQQSKTKRNYVLGIVPSKGRYVVDIDTKKNVSALQLWKDKVVEAYGDISLATPNLVVKTKSGGYHLYYSDGSDRQLHSPTSIFGKDSGIDIRGYTGMVIAPTSIGTDADWQLGEYIVIQGRPSDELTVLGLSKILGDTFDQVDDFIRTVLTQVNEALRNDSVGPLHRHRLLPDSLVIPSSNRDNTLYRCARLCRLADLTQGAATVFMQHVAARCETTPEEPTEHWIKLAIDKVQRVYASESEMRLKSVSSLYEEFDNAGTVLLRGVSKSYFYFRHGSKLLRIDPRTRYSTDNIGNVLQGVVVHTEDGAIPARKVITGYSPKEVAYNATMYPKTDTPYFEFEGITYVNTYYDSFSAFEPNEQLLARAAPMVEAFKNFVKHVTGYQEGDDEHLLDKLAWILQRPYRRLPTGTIIYSHTRGSGKDVFMSIIRELVGRPYYMPINLTSIEDKHMSFHDRLVCTASEVQLQANARGQTGAANFLGKLKDLITAKTVTVNNKFEQAFTAPIFANFFILSNFELSSILEPGDRRFDIFHTAEEKLDQDKFGDLADLTNDGVWVEKPAMEQDYRRHAIYAIRQYLMERPVAAAFDREEAVMNEVKTDIMQYQQPPAIEWIRNNLPKYFTEEVAMMACHFCPLKIHPEYVLKKLKEHYGPEMMPVYRTNAKSKSIFRVNGAPKLEKRDSGGQEVPVLNFNVQTSDATSKKTVYVFRSTLRDAFPTDTVIKHEIKSWYNTMVAQYFGNVAKLPNQKPDPDATPDILA